MSGIMYGAATWAIKGDTGIMFPCSLLTTSKSGYCNRSCRTSPSSVGCGDFDFDVYQVMTRLSCASLPRPLYKPYL